MKNYKSACLFLVVLSAAGCSKTIRNSEQAGLPGQADAGQQKGAPDPLPSLTPTPVPSSSPSVTPSASPSVCPSPSPSASPSASVTSTAATAESLQAKYQLATLRCDLEFPLEYDYLIVSVKSFGSDSFTWDLLKDYSQQKAFELNAKTFRKDLIVNFAVKNVAFENTDKGETALTVQGNYSFESATPISFLKMSSAVSGNGPFQFYENSEARLVDEYVGTAEGNASDEYGVLLNCILSTKLKASTSATMTE